MKVLNLYHSQTQNTLKVAETIEKAARDAGCDVKTMQAKPGADSVQLLEYDLIFIGSGVYAWLPGKAMIEWLGERAKENMQEFGGTGLFKPGSPRLSGKYYAVYCTFGGSHTGINEAIPAVKYMGQLFDHLGLTNAAEWYIPGAYHVPKLKHHNIEGRLGDISNRPNENDLASITEKVKGLIESLKSSITTA
jgi:flavodoxin